jgi:hypothetical protein
VSPVVRVPISLSILAAAPLGLDPASAPFPEPLFAIAIIEEPLLIRRGLGKRIIEDGATLHLSTPGDGDILAATHGLVTIHAVERFIVD